MNDLGRVKGVGGFFGVGFVLGCDLFVSVCNTRTRIQEIKPTRGVLKANIKEWFSLHPSIADICRGSTGD